MANDAFFFFERRKLKIVKSVKAKYLIVVIWNQGFTLIEMKKNAFKLALVNVYVMSFFEDCSVIFFFLIECQRHLHKRSSAHKPWLNVFRFWFIWKCSYSKSQWMYNLLLQVTDLNSKNLLAVSWIFVITRYNDKNGIQTVNKETLLCL